MFVGPNLVLPTKLNCCLEGFLFFFETFCGHFFVCGTARAAAIDLLASDSGARGYLLTNGLPRR